MIGRRTLAAWRLARCVLHLLHGLWVCMVELPRAGEDVWRHRIRWWNAKTLRLMGITLHASGTAADGPLLLAANHVSWLDVMAVNAVQPSRFVSKSDVRAWPLVGRLVEGGGTLFIDRSRRRDAHRVVHGIAEALAAGDRVAIFPEGTTGDGERLLPFHANLLQAAIATCTPVQPVAICYDDARGRNSRAVVWLGDTTLFGSMWRIACAESLTVHVGLLQPLLTAGLDRRALAERLRARIEPALALLPSPPGRG